MAQDIVRLLFHSFFFERFNEKMVHILMAKSIPTYNGFVRVFIGKYFRNGKIVKLRNEINHFIQFEKQLFWKCFERLKL